MSDRAEQAKALTRKTAWHVENGVTQLSRDFVRELSAALSASEAEVTRLETGIAEALLVGGDDHATVLAEVWRILEALSQPTTDTNGAHA